jgi:hypothetical protein
MPLQQVARRDRGSVGCGFRVFHPSGSESCSGAARGCRGGGLGPRPACASTRAMASGVLATSVTRSRPWQCSHPSTSFANTCSIRRALIQALAEQGHLRRRSPMPARTRCRTRCLRARRHRGRRERAFDSCRCRPPARLNVLAHQLLDLLTQGLVGIAHVCAIPRLDHRLNVHRERQSHNAGCRPPHERRSRRPGALQLIYIPSNPEIGR